MRSCRIGACHDRSRAVHRWTFALPESCLSGSAPGASRVHDRAFPGIGWKRARRVRDGTARTVTRRVLPGPLRAISAARRRRHVRVRRRSGLERRRTRPSARQRPEEHGPGPGLRRAVPVPLPPWAENVPGCGRLSDSDSSECSSERLVFDTAPQDSDSIRATRKRRLRAHVSGAGGDHEKVCQRDGRGLAQGVALTDIYIWKLLRRDRGLSRAETERAIVEMLSALMGDKS